VLALLLGFKPVVAEALLSVPAGFKLHLAIS
jgi:hypothetical protein